MPGPPDLLLSAPVFRTRVDHLRTTGRRAVTLDGANVRDVRSFSREVSSKTPLNPPLVSTDNLDGLVDSMFGGFADAQVEAFVWTRGWIMRESNPEDFSRLLEMLHHLRADLLVEPPRGAGLLIEILVEVAGDLKPDDGAQAKGTL